MVEGYETEREREQRLRREEAERQAGIRAEQLATARTVRALIPQTLERVRLRTPDCVIEIFGRTRFSDKSKVSRRVPGWYLGSIITGYVGYSIKNIPTHTHVAIGVDGKLHWNPEGVGVRREFAVRGQVGGLTDESLFGYTALVELLRSAGSDS